MSRSEKETIFLFTHSNRIKCLLENSKVLVDGNSEPVSIKHTLENKKDNSKTFKKYFNNITFHIQKTPEGNYEITVLDAGSTRSKGDELGNEDLSYYREGTIENYVMNYLTIAHNDALATSLKKNSIESIVISRHGHGRHNKVSLGFTDARLTPKGRRDTENTALRIKDNIKHLTPKYIFTSELFRTMQTAAIFMRNLDYVTERVNRDFYIVRCNHELSGDQINDIGNCNKNLEDTLESIGLKDKLKSILGEENRPERLNEKIESFNFSEEDFDSNNTKVVLTSEELNCSKRRYTKSCHKKDMNMFNNINIVFYINKGKKSDCEDYAVFHNIKDNIDTIISSPEGLNESMEASPEANKSSKGGTIRKLMKKRKRRTIRRKSKRFTKKRNKRRTNKKRFTKRR